MEIILRDDKDELAILDEHTEAGFVQVCATIEGQSHCVTVSLDELYQAARCFQQRANE